MVLFSFKPKTTDEEARALLEELAAFPDRYPAMRRFGIGENVSERDRTFSHVMTIEFDRPEQLEAYLNSHDHDWFVKTRFRPHVEDRVIASYETG